MVRAACDVAPVFSATRRNATDQKQSRIRKVATLARSGERGQRSGRCQERTTSTSHSAGCSREQKSLHHRPGSCRSCSNTSVESFFLSEVTDLVPTTLRKMPRLSELGPLGMRAAHWYDFGDQAGDSNLLVQAVQHTSQRLQSRTRCCQKSLLMAAKKKAEVRGQVCWTSTIWRGTPGWCQHHDQDNPVPRGIRFLSSLLVALDVKAAFQNVSRRAMLHSIE